MTLYEILGVPADVNDDDLKKAYRALSKEHHPDINSDAGAEDRFKDIQKAYEILSDPDRRAEYDRTGKVDTASHDVFQEYVIRKASEMMNEMLFSTHYKTDIDNYLMSETQSIVRKRLQAEQMFKRDRESISNIEEHCKKRAVIDVLAGVLAQKRAVVDSAEAAMLNDIKIFDAAVLLLREYVFDKAKSSVASSSSAAQFQIKINMFGGTTA